MLRFGKTVTAFLPTVKTIMLHSIKYLKAKVCSVWVAEII